MNKKQDLQSRVGNSEDFGDLVPAKAWFTLKESCTIKGLNYKTACNRTVLQPNKGVPDGTRSLSVKLSCSG